MKTVPPTPPPVPTLNKIHHSAPLGPDNGSAAPATHHSLPKTIGCVNTADSHVHTGRTVSRVWGSSPGLNVSARPPPAPHDSEPPATPDPGHQSVTRWLRNCSFTHPFSLAHTPTPTHIVHKHSSPEIKLFQAYVQVTHARMCTHAASHFPTLFDKRQCSWQAQSCSP